MEESEDNFFTVKTFAKLNKEKQRWPESEAAIWALRAEREINGFDKAFVCISRRVLICEKEFWDAVRSYMKRKE